MNNILTENEYTILKEMFMLGYRYIARNKNNLLVVSKKKLERDQIGIVQEWCVCMWKPYEDALYYPKFLTHLFTFISWENEKPYNIGELLNEKKNI